MRRAAVLLVLLMVRPGMKLGTRTALFVAILLIAILPGAEPAGARPTALVFGLDCSDGEIDLTESVTVEGGVGNWSGACQVTLGPSVKLRLIDVSLTGGSLSIVGDEASAVEIRDSTIDSEIGTIHIHPGNIANKGMVKLSGATLTSNGTGPVSVHASRNGLKGKVFIKDSFITSDTDNDVSIRASDVDGARGSVRVIRGTLSADNATVSIVTGILGRTFVRRVTFIAHEADILTGIEGKCTADHNMPDHHCQ